MFICLFVCLFISINKHLIIPFVVYIDRYFVSLAI